MWSRGLSAGEYFVCELFSHVCAQGYTSWKDVMVFLLDWRISRLATEVISNIVDVEQRVDEVSSGDSTVRVRVRARRMQIFPHFYGLSHLTNASPWKFRTLSHEGSFLGTKGISARLLACNPLPQPRGSGRRAPWWLEDERISPAFNAHVFC